MDGILFSFIVPHKNLPQGYLRRCLDSIPHDDDVQIIVVDDGSDPSIVDLDALPGIGEKCTEIVFNKECHGLGHARNIAIPLAKGEWLFFTDSDDYYDTGALGTLMAELRRGGAYDVIYFGYNIIGIDGSDNEHSFKGCKGTNIIEVTDRRQFYEGEHYAWCKVIHLSILKDNKLHFQEVKRQEDVLFAVQLLNCAQRIGLFFKPIYCYQMREGSIANTSSLSTIRIGMNVYIESYRWMRQHQLPYICDASWRFLYSIRRESYLLALYYLIKEAIEVDLRTALHDFRKVNSIPGKMRMVIFGHIQNLKRRLL